MKIVIMCGGGGTRLWPVSRDKHPKQFQKLLSQKSLLQQTYARARKIVAVKDIVIATNQKFVREIKKQLPQVPAQNFVLEPAKRDNAAAVGLSCLEIAYRLGNPADVMVMLAADHVIPDVKQFKNLVKKAVNYVEQNPEYIGTLGITPTYPETGYGYIRSTGEEVSTGVFKVERFVEKPDIKNAKKYIKNNNYYWNACIFIWQLGNMLELYRQHLPQIYKGLLKIKSKLGKKDYRITLDQVYPTLQKTSVDFGIMEKIKKIVVIPTGNLEWNDIGNWAAVYDLKDQDKDGNVLSQNVITLDSKKNLILSDKKLIAALGVENIVLIETPDAILVASKDRVHEVKKLLEKVPKKYL